MSEKWVGTYLLPDMENFCEPFRGTYILLLLKTKRLVEAINFHT